MSHRSGPNKGEPPLTATESDDDVLRDLLGWGRLLSALVQVLDPFYRIEDLMQTDHPLRDSDKPLGAIVRSFGKGSEGAAFLDWWTGGDGTLPFFDCEEGASRLLPLGLAYRWRASELQASAWRSFQKFDTEWAILRDRLLHRRSSEEALYSRPLEEPEWRQVERRMAERPRLAQPASPARLDQAIERVRSFFAPLESPLFGMDSEMLAHHVQETIPREGPTETLTPIVPLFGKGHLQKAFPSSAQLPAHLRVILHRLVRSQQNDDLVTSLLATLEAIDFSLRFATGIGQGNLALLEQTDFAGTFNPITRQIIEDLEEVVERLPRWRDDRRAQAGWNLLFQGSELHPFLIWGGIGGDQRLLSWMKEAEDTIRQDNPARSAALLAEVMEQFNGWVGELTLLCSSWDLVTHVRQDGYLQISLGRGDVWFSCKPLIDPTRYSVWLDRSELTLVNKGGTLHAPRDSKEPVESLDGRLSLRPEDPPFLKEQLAILVRAHEQGQILPLGRALFFGLEYLVRLHASLAGGYLRHSYVETSLLDPVERVGGSLEHVVYFLIYSQRLLGLSPHPEAEMLRSIFFRGDTPREFSVWLGLDGGVPGPLQGLLGWSLSLMRPDAKTRLDEVRGQVERLSGYFADFLEESRRLWKEARLQTDTTPEGSEAVVLTFPSGLRLRGYPDVSVGPRMERGRRGVLVGDESEREEQFSDWEGEDLLLPPTPQPEDSREQPSWPSFFDDSEGASTAWPGELFEAVSRTCQARSFSGPDARPRAVAEEVAAVVTGRSEGAAGVLFCKGAPGTGKTFLCRTLTNPACTPLPEDYPVLYLRVDRFPRTRLATVVERLNDHIASEGSMERFSWNSVPLESLKSLGSEVARLSDDLADLGVSSEPLANRLSSYLRQLRKLNEGRRFLLILDGFEAIPRSIVPSSLPPGVHLLITGTSLPDLDVPSTPYMEYRSWELDGPVGEATFTRQLHGLQLGEAEKRRARDRFRGSLFLARVYRDLRNLDEEYPLSGDALGDLLAEARAKFSEPEKYRTFLRLLVVLGLYERPVPLTSLQRKVHDAGVVLKAISSFPSLFSFWDEPAPSLALGHSLVLERIGLEDGLVEAVSQELAESFLANPRRGELMAALHWFDKAGSTAALVERFFLDEVSLTLWRDELASLNDRGLFFQRVALLDAMAEPLFKAVEQGAGNLREELAWVYNARGLSLLELGLVAEAVGDFDSAIELFTEQFASGDLHILEALASALSRRAEAALKADDLETAAESSARALELLDEKVAASTPLETVAELRSRILLQSARTHLATRGWEDVLEGLSHAIADLEKVDPERRTRLRGECFLVAAQALSALGSDEEAVEHLDTAVELLMTGPTAELGLQALILRGRLQHKLGLRREAEGDLRRALSLLRYHVAVGRLDLEPLLAYTVALAASVGDGRMAEAQELSDSIGWARRRIRYEGRTDLRGLLAYLLLTRGSRWKGLGYFSRAASDLRAATEQYDLLSHEIAGHQDRPVWSALRQSFRNLTALYLSLDEPHLALICGRRALELGRRPGKEADLSEESVEIGFGGATQLSGEADPLLENRLFQLGKLYSNLGEAARRVGLREEGATYLERSARALRQALASFDEAPEGLAAEYALVLKRAARAAFQDGDLATLEHWLQTLDELPDGLLSDYDRFLSLRWSGQSARRRGDLSQSQDSHERALEALQRLEEHPRRRSLEVEALLDLGRVLSLRGRHEEALKRLELAAQTAQDAVFSEGDESKELLVLCALHSAVAELRAGRIDQALEQLRILVSMRPGADVHEVEALAQDWLEAWSSSQAPGGIELIRSLGQLAELGDWLLRTALGGWYRDLVLSLLEDVRFESVIMSSGMVDRILETYLILTFNSAARDTGGWSNPEIEKLLAAKFRAFDSENRDLEAELLLGHLLPIQLKPESGGLLLRRSEMALLRGDRGLAIIDLLRAIEGGGEERLRAHLRLAEFLQSRGLNSAAVHHLLQALRSMEAGSEGLSSLCGRSCRLLTRLAREAVRLDLDFYRQHFRVLAELEASQLTPTLELAWLRPVREPREWLELLELTLTVVSRWQRVGHDKPSDWAFLEEVVDRAVLCHGQLPLAELERLGQLLSAALSTFDVQNQARANALWERFANFLPGLGKRTALDLLQRLVDFTERETPDEGQAQEFLRRLEEEKRILVQPR